MQRFRAALATEVSRGNPESLLRDRDGDYVLYEEARLLKKKNSFLINILKRY